MGLDIALCATDYATERRNWMRKRAVITLDSESKIEGEQQFFKKLQEELNLAKPRTQTYDSNAMLKALEIS